MADDDLKTVQSASGKFSIYKSPDFRSVYSNNATFQTGPFDFVINFGEVVEVNAAEATAKIEQHVRVTMSPLHAKIFALMLRDQVKGFEATFGEIKIPPTVLPVQPDEVVEFQAPVQAPIQTGQ